LPLFESEKSKNADVPVTVSVNVVECDREPEVAVTVIVDDPVGVEADVVMDNVVEHVGVQDVGENEVVVPAGKPEAENETDCDVPETSVAVIVLDTGWPWTTVRLPLFESEKSKDGGVAFTVRVNVVVCDREPEVAVTVIVDDPVGVEADVVMDSVVEHVGVQDVGENEVVVPAGKPEAENEADALLPERRVAVIVFVTEFP
jgi:hypothetical protein